MAYNALLQAETELIAEKYAAYLNDEELDYFNHIVDSYCNLRLKMLNHVDASVMKDINIVKSYVVFTNMAPWECEQDDFILWGTYLKNKGLERSTLRSYHGAVRRFYEYFSSNTKHSKEIRRRFNVTPTVICDKHVCIAHVNEQEASEKTNTDALSYADVNKLFETLDLLIDESRAYGGCKDLYPLLRDRTLIYLTYTMGLRADEALRLDTDSFIENPKHPEFGTFGRIKVKGKGHSGGGKKPRILPITSIKLPVELYNYIYEVRPEFLRRADPNDNALFLSQRCSRLTYQSYWSRFSKILNEIGLGDKGYALHTLRRTGLTHNAELMSLQTIQKLAGHARISTTSAYLHRESNIVASEIDSVIAAQIDAALMRRLL